MGENLAGPVSVMTAGEIVRLNPGFAGGISSLGGCAGERLRVAPGGGKCLGSDVGARAPDAIMLGR